MAEDRLIIFVHVPKTAGITMNQILCRQYGREGCFGTAWGPEMSEDASRHLALYVGIKLEPGDTWYPEPLQVAAFRFLALPDEERTRIRAIRGHMSFGLDRHLPPPTAYFTLLRDPVDQVLSGYYYTADWQHWPGNMSLHEHIASLSSEGNLQTRMLAGPYDDDAGELPPPAEMLERAKRNLRSCAVVGLTERFDETVLLLRNAFGWRWPLYVRTNVNRERLPRSAIPPDTIRQIAAGNALDMALYEYAQELFDEQVKQYGPSLEGDLRTFRALNALWQRWCKAKRVSGDAFKALGRLVWPLFDPAYSALAEWGGLRRLLPARLSPRVVAPQTLGDAHLRLWMGERVIGRYDASRQRWKIRRPFHLFVDESELLQMTRIGDSLRRPL